MATLGIPPLPVNVYSVRPVLDQKLQVKRIPNIAKMMPSVFKTYIEVLDVMHFLSTFDSLRDSILSCFSSLLGTLGSVQAGPGPTWCWGWEKLQKILIL